MGDDAATRLDATRSEVMAAIDSDGHGPRLVIADVSADGSWVSIGAAEAACLADWR